MAKAFWTTAFLLAASILWPAAARAAIIHVPGDYKSIQQAIDAAVPADEIIVGEGVYKENILIEKPVSLRASAGPSATVIEAADKSKPSIKVDKAVNATLRGFSATGSMVAGVLVSGSDNITLADCAFTDNTSGIIMNNTTGSTIKNNASNSNAQYGLYMEKSHNNRIEQNTANLNQDKGFFISNSNGNKILNNSVNLNSWDGIMLYASTGNTVSGNKTLRNTYGIVISESPGNEVFENTTLPNLFLILPIVLIYLGVVSYLVQKNVLKAVYKE
jgi:parallel beta-helix repeat protein